MIILLELTNVGEEKKTHIYNYFLVEACQKPKYISNHNVHRHYTVTKLILPWIFFKIFLDFLKWES